MTRLEILGRLTEARRNLAAAQTHEGSWGVGYWEGQIAAWAIVLRTMPAPRRAVPRPRSEVSS